MKIKFKKFVLFLILLTPLFFLNSLAKAATINDPAMTLKKGKSWLGFEIDMAKNDIKLKDDNEAFELKRNNYLYKESYGITNKIDIFYKLGISNMEMKINELVKFDKAIKGDPEFSFGAGINTVLYGQDNLKFGLCIQFLKYNSGKDLNEIIAADFFYSGDSYSSYEVKLTKAEMQAIEYDIAFSVSYYINKKISLFGNKERNNLCINIVRPIPYCFNPIYGY